MTFTFDTREALDDKLLAMNYDDGVTGAEGRMNHYGSEDDDIDDLIHWVPTFPVEAIGAKS